MPVRNEADFIERSLRAALQQDYPHNRMEVIVADGMSEDRTRDIIAKLVADLNDDRVRIIDNLGQIAPTGLNAAFQASHGDIIIRVDGHCVIEPNYISRCVHYLQSTEADGVGGTIESVCGISVGEAIALGMSSKFGVGNVGFRTGENVGGFVDTVPFPAYRRAAIEHAGPYDEQLVRNQDDEYNYRLRKLGHKILLAPDIKSRYFTRNTLASTWRQYYQYGVYKVRVLQKHPRQMQVRQFVPFAFVTSLGMSLLGGLFSKRLRFVATAIAAVYALGNIVASITIARRAGWTHLRFLPLVFAVLHFSYGLGFARGLVKFRNQWNDT